MMALNANQTHSDTFREDKSTLVMTDKCYLHVQHWYAMVSEGDCFHALLLCFWLFIVGNGAL